jgi:hypothetical protein
MSPSIALVEQSADRARLLQWLLVPGGPGTAVWAVRADHHLLGAAALAGGPNPAAWIRVVDPHREQGVGSRLWRALGERAVLARCASVSAARPVDENVARWAQRRGAEIGGELTEFSASLARSLERQRLAWTRIRHRMPAQCRIITLREVEAEGRLADVAGTLAPAIGGQAARWLQRAERSLRSPVAPDFDPECSLVMILEGAVIGAQTTRFDPSEFCWFNEAITIIPEFRQGWASVALRIAAGEAKLHAALTDEVRFRARNDHPDTLRMARHLDAKVRWTRQFIQWKPS